MKIMRLRIRILQSVIVGLVTLSPTAHAQVSVREIATSAQSAMVTVHAYENGSDLAFGSGFFVREDGVLVTNLHVVQGATSVAIEIESGEIYDNVFVLGIDERRDLIILQVPLSDASILEIDDDRNVEVGDQVYVIGNPLGLQGTFSDGLVSAKRVEEGVAYLQISAPISEGSSGGPVINSLGRAIGVSTLTISDGQNLNLAVPVRHAADLLKISDEPVAFESLVADLESPLSDDEPSRSEESQAYLDLLPDEVRAELDDVNSYEQQAIIRQYVFAAFLEEGGYSSTDNINSSVLGTGEMDKLTLDLERGYYIAIGTCDDDCVDLDLYVLDANGEIVGSDTMDDPEPMPEFELDKRGVYTLGVSMESCATTNCVYVVDVYRQE